MTPQVFSRYPDAAAYAGADRAELETMIQSTGFFRNKSDTLIKLGGALVEHFDGRVPGRLADLVTLPGVGRKTANVVLGNAFGVPGITVDTHFGRLVRRFRVDHGDRPGQGRARDRRDVPAARLDDAQPRPDLSRSPDLPCEEAGLRRLPCGRLVPELRHRPDRPSRGPAAAGVRAEAGGGAPGPAARTAAGADRPTPSSADRRPSDL